MSLLRKFKDMILDRPPRAQALISEEFLKSLTYIVDLDQLLENLTAKLRELTQASALFTVLFEPITNRYVGKKVKGASLVLLTEFDFSPSDNLIKWLTVNRTTLNVAKDKEVVRFLSRPEQAILSKASIELVVPLVIVNRLTGALFVARKLDGLEYSPDATNILSVVVGQSALAIEYALLAQFQEDKLKKLFHADKLATIGELAAGAAHEIRNPLTSIRSTIQYLQKDLPEEKRNLVNGIIAEVDRIDQIIKGLLSFSGKATSASLKIPCGGPW